MIIPVISLQLHHRRSEHEIQIKPNESTYITVDIPHRLMSPDTADCGMIEIRVGDYVGEDDIVRFDDIYGRGQQP